MAHIQVCVPGLGRQAHVCVNAMHTCVSSACTRVHVHLTTPALTRLSSAAPQALGRKAHHPQHRCSPTGRCSGAWAPACAQSAWLPLAPAEKRACLGCVCSFLPADAREQWLSEGWRRPSGPRAGRDMDRAGHTAPSLAQGGDQSRGPGGVVPPGVQQEPSLEGRREQLRAKTPLGASHPRQEPSGGPRPRAGWCDSSPFGSPSPTAL